MGATKLSIEALADIQGFITSGYGHLPQAAYLFLQFHDASRSRHWLGILAAIITTAKPWPKTTSGEKIRPAVTINVGFTHDGLSALGLPDDVLCTFPEEFQEGIARPNRSRILGDTGHSDPARWEFAGAGQPSIHGVLIIHAATPETLQWACDEQRRVIAASSGGVVELTDCIQRGYRPRGDHEPFGFHDGVGQPSIAGIDDDGVPTGEFILGYENHYDVIPPSPVVAATLDTGGILPSYENPYHRSGQLRDLGRNGSFVVYRKLRQDVAGFWQLVKREANRHAVDDPCGMVLVAARMVGRWPSGAALMLSPDSDDPSLRDRNDFLYREDPDGSRCPIGAHIRRSNPRDDVKPYPAAESLSMTEAHRLLRRARVFGPPLFDPELLRDPASDACRTAILQIQDDGQSRGIHFFCVNASIRSQFEFVQQTWCNNPLFGGLHDAKDPIAGDGEPRLVTVRAGAYLFMPSMKALRFLAAGGRV